MTKAPPSKRIKRNKKSENLNIENQENTVEPRTIVSIFRETVDECAHDRLIVQMKVEFYDKLSIQEFSQQFNMCLLTLLAYDSRTKTEIPFKFIVKFVISCLRRAEGVALTKADKLIFEFVTFFLDKHDICQHMVRLHVVQLIRILLSELTEDVEIPDLLFEKMQETVVRRLWDTKVRVRAEAAIASSRLQDPNDTNCSIVTGLIHLTRYDSSHIVRQAAMQALAITTKTLPSILARCNDINDGIRRKALELLSKWKILKPLTITKRLQIIENGLRDKIESVQIACQNLLLVWFDICENDPVKLLKRLDVENNEESTRLTFNALLNNLPEEKIMLIVDFLKNIMDNKNLIVEENLTSESAFLWTHIVIFLSRSQDKYPDQLEKLTPSILVFEAYIRRLLQRPPSAMEKENTELITLVKQLLPIIKYLDVFDQHNRQKILDLIKWALSSRDVSFEYSDSFMSLLVHLEKKDNKICDLTVEMINDLLFGDSEFREVGSQKVLSAAEAPNTNETPIQEDALIVLDNVSAAESILDQSEIMKNRQRQKKFELATLHVRLNELQESVHQRMNTESDLGDCSELLEDIKTLKMQIKDLKLDIHRLQTRPATEAVAGQLSPAQVATVVQTTEAEEDNAVGTSAKSERMDIDEPTVNQVEAVQAPQEMEFMKPGKEFLIMKANIITICMIQECKMLWNLTASLRALFENVIIHSVQHPNLAVREKAFLTLGLCCLLDKQLAVKFYTIFMGSLTIDHDFIKDVAVRSLVDMFIRFGIEPFQEAMQLSKKEQVDQEATKLEQSMSIIKMESEASTVTSMSPDHISDEEYGKYTVELLSPIINLLSSEAGELQTCVAMGLTKLIYNQKLMSAKLLSRLLLMWFDTQTNSNSRLREHLTGLFGSFTCMSAKNQVAVCSCFLPTVRTVLRAQSDSPLAEVDVGNVVQFFVRATDSVMLQDNQVRRKLPDGKFTTEFKNPAPDENPCHDELAKVACEQLQRSTTSADGRTYAVMLGQLRLSQNNTQLRQELVVGLYKAESRMRDRKVLLIVQQYRQSLQSQIQEGSPLHPAEALLPPPDTPLSGVAYSTASDRPTLLEEAGTEGHSVYLGSRFGVGHKTVTSVAHSVAPLADCSVVEIDDEDEENDNDEDEVDDETSHVTRFSVRVTPSIAMVSTPKPTKANVRVTPRSAVKKTTRTPANVPIFKNPDDSLFKVPNLRITRSSTKASSTPKTKKG